MKLNEEKLKELYAQRQVERGRPDECVSQELLRRAAARELTEVERARVVAHLRACSQCARDYRIAHSTRQWAAQVAPLLGNGARERETIADSASQAWWRQLLQPLGGRTAAFAGLALMVIAISFIAWRATRPIPVEAPGERGSSNVKLTITPADKASLEEAPAQLTWSKVESADSYQVTLYDFELTPVWESHQLSATSVQLPDSVRAQLPPGQIIYWRVSFLTGIERRQSNLFQFIVKGRPN
jgi:hypothetical protein